MEQGNKFLAVFSGQLHPSGGESSCLIAKDSPRWPTMAYIRIRKDGSPRGDMNKKIIERIVRIYPGLPPMGTWAIIGFPNLHRSDRDFWYIWTEKTGEKTYRYSKKGKEI